MGREIVITSETIKDFIKENGKLIKTGSKEYYHLPFWFRFRSDSNLVDVFSQHDLPEDLKAAIADTRFYM